MITPPTVNDVGFLLHMSIGLALDPPDMLPPFIEAAVYRGSALAPGDDAADELFVAEIRTTKGTARYAATYRELTAMIVAAQIDEEIDPRIAIYEALIEQLAALGGPPC